MKVYYSSVFGTVVFLCFSTTTSFLMSTSPALGTHRLSAKLASNKNEMDVSDLDLTMDDLNKPLPPELWQGISSSGYESTNRLPDVLDNGCEWNESPNDMAVTLKIPGLRGQPAMAASVLFSTTTISISFFGRVVWSAILRGTIDPEACNFETEDGGADMIPIIRINIAKEAASERWGGFILQVGEDSLV